MRLHLNTLDLRDGIEEIWCEAYSFSVVVVVGCGCGCGCGGCDSVDLVPD